jgi:nicotinamidase-related amidase
MNTPKTALIIIDFINEIIQREGKLAGKGYADYDERHGVLDKANKLLQYGRAAGFLPVFVRVGFSRSYAEHPENSPLFGAARKFGALCLGCPATEFHSKLQPLPEEIVVTKHRVSAFFDTPLELLLRTNKVNRVLIAGVATDLAVQAAARDAHDRDFAVVVISDCCAAANDEDHTASLAVLKKIGTVITLSELQSEASN